ncbi:hypothetical protein B1729_01290 [Microbacterium sp. B35-04]|uniref:hypothetical protein n=1 Tax=unclassified Microbacterium TaxID=2609290 RepID=UPI0013D50796|nr:MULTISPECIES: hypothetical protein [unclassified Microbacterium]KAF2415146.1 hypothetical protein B1729_01290 [Microbacterium sp. B35-04]KAF2420101.1 hypothetical protein B2K11_02925 [Microbacterium sp. B35-30]
MTWTSRLHVSRGEGFALGLIATGAISVAVAALVAVVRGAVEIFGSAPTVRMLVTRGDVSDLAGVPEISAASYASADVTFTELPGAVGWMLWLELALPALATIGVCIVAWWLGVSLMRARPFRRAMSTAIGVVAVLVVVGGVLSQVLGAFGRALLVDDLAATSPEVVDVFGTFIMELDLAPVGWGFALALVAGAFEIGTRLQRETEGLV